MVLMAAQATVVTTFHTVVTTLHAEYVFVVGKKKIVL